MHTFGNLLEERPVDFHLWCRSILGPGIESDRDFKTGEQRFEPRGKHLARRNAGGHLHKSNGSLTERSVGYGDDDRALHPVEREQRLFDLFRMDVLAARDEQGVGPAKHAQETVRVEGAPVAGVKPSIGVARPAQRIAVDVSLEQYRPSHQDLSVLGHPDLSIGQATPRRAEPDQRCVRREIMQKQADEA